MRCLPKRIKTPGQQSVQSLCEQPQVSCRTLCVTQPRTGSWDTLGGMQWKAGEGQQKILGNVGMVWGIAGKVVDGMGWEIKWDMRWEGFVFINWSFSTLTALAQHLPCRFQVHREQGGRERTGAELHSTSTEGRPCSQNSPLSAPDHPSHV